jgi:hypothetical protein
MGENQRKAVRQFLAVPHTPVLPRVVYPVIEIKDRMIRVSLDDIDDHKIELRFQPYQALNLTTRDCFLMPAGSEHLRNRIFYQRTSTWIEELKSALQVSDRTADFMDKALHFTIPAGDDVLEIAAWKVEITHLDKTFRFPKNVEMPLI